MPLKPDVLPESTDRRPDRATFYRLYRPDDEEAVRRIFAKQGLKVHLPLPSDDPSVTPGMIIVAEEDGDITMAFIMRATLELHAVVDPCDKIQAYKLRRIEELAEGLALGLSVEMSKLKLPVFTDFIAFVPRQMPDMIKYMRDQGFIDESDTSGFKMLWKRLGT